MHGSEIGDFYGAILANIYDGVWATHAEDRIISIQDVTERRAAEASLRQSQQRLEDLVRTARAAIAIHGPDGRLLQTNPLADELLGLGAAEGTGRALTDTSWQFLQAGP